MSDDDKTVAFMLRIFGAECEAQGCGEPATVALRVHVGTREPRLVVYCAEHADVVRSLALP